MGPRHSGYMRERIIIHEVADVGRRRSAFGRADQGVEFQKDRSADSGTAP